MERKNALPIGILPYSPYSVTAEFPKSALHTMEFGELADAALAKTANVYPTVWQRLFRMQVRRLGQMNCAA